jgi:hypothetical protein
MKSLFFYQISNVIKPFYSLQFIVDMVDIVLCIGYVGLGSINYPMVYLVLYILLFDL